MKRAGIKLTEAELQRGVIERAQALGWKVMHPLPGQTRKGWATSTQGDGKGYPDLTLVRERIIFAELKAEGKYLSIEQKMWRDWILAAGGEWYMWKPLQWFDKTIDMLLGVKVEAPQKVESALPDETDERWRRILGASGGDTIHALRIWESLEERGTPPPQ